MLDFFTGRSNRQEYWISVGLLVVVALALNYFNMQAASAAITIMWIITWIRRLHDVGMPSWYAAVPILLLLALVFAAFALGGDQFQKVLLAIQSNDMKSIPDSSAYLFMGVVLAGLIIQFGFTIWLGAKAGDKGNNKFGPPPGTAPRG